MIIVGTPQSHDGSCQQYCTVVDSQRNWWGLPYGRAKPDQSRNAADTCLVEPRGDFLLDKPISVQSQILTQKMSLSLKTQKWQRRAENTVFVKNGCVNLTG